ncbi:MAG TPA: hypothetical protein VHE81_14280, partial [Lacipirellulaceae bacterium]|nr:hypothetical protein [Lacipirellulaceae bacterium]
VPRRGMDCAPACAGNDRQPGRCTVASHGDKLPNVLADVTDVPIPIDPVTEKPFEYHRDGERATLRGPSLAGAPLDYEITMVRRQ